MNIEKEFFASAAYDFDLYENIVVGSGPGGSLAACMLAEAGRDVMILEEGIYHSKDKIPPFSVDEMQYQYRNGGVTMAFGKPRVQYVEAITLGGGSEINSGLYHRLPEEVCERWKKDYRLASLSYKDIIKFASQIEKDICVSKLPCPPPVASCLLAEGSEALGWKCLEVPRWHRYDVAQPSGERQTMTKTYLPRALKAGAKLASGVRVTKIKREKNFWVAEGVRICLEEGKPYNIALRCRNLFLAAGAVQTPALLAQSGFKGKFGHALHMHPTIKVVALFPEEMNSIDMGVPVHQVKEFEGISFGCSISNPHYLSVSMLNQPQGLDIVRNCWKQMAIYYAMITPEGRGRVRSLPHFSNPLVTCSLTRRDMILLSAALKNLSKLLFAAGATALYPTITGLNPFNKIDDLSSLPNALPPSKSSLMTIHLTSAMAMAGDSALGPVDEWGKLYAAEDIYISDAGILPTAPGVNPQGTLLALVRRNMEHFLNKARLK
ncbi:MAG: GMC family oxidoreductase [Deferribacteraceae bacterium]|jgi:choline dehydrogenase-like flavoprotein|nr:GMC family oxidoreductase [Deferribacteraceae bacterium]